MPAPLSPFSGRRFAIIIDAGSSGSRAQIYSWPANAGRHGKGLPRIELGLGRELGEVADAEGEVKTGWKVEPGISTLEPRQDVLEEYLAQLLKPALALLPPSAIPSTPIHILATAGMRLLPDARRSALLRAARSAVRALAPLAPASSDVRVISGEEEGLFGWLAVNYLMDGFEGPHGRGTWGFLDMGGASTQIAFEPRRGWGEGREKDGEGMVEVGLRMLDGRVKKHRVFVTTWLGYGTNQARQRYVDARVAADGKEEESSDPTHPLSNPPTLLDPCLPPSLALAEHSPSSSPAAHTHTFLGTGSFGACLQFLHPLLEKESQRCAHPPCLFGGQRVPPIDFTLSRFVGVSEYWFSSEHIFGLGGAWDLVRFERAAADFCARGWDETAREYEDGRVAGVGGRWGDEVDLGRLQMQCFKAAWIVEVLHEGIGLPRIVDPGGNVTEPGRTPDEEGREKAEDKGLAPPHDAHEPAFQSLNTINSVPISWTLGAVLLAASDSPSPFVSSSTLAPSSSFDSTDTPPPHRRPLLASRVGAPDALLLPLAALMLLLLALLFARLRRLRRFAFADFLPRRRPSASAAAASTIEEGRAPYTLNDSPPSSSPKRFGPARSSSSGAWLPTRVLSSLRQYLPLPSRPPRHPSSALPKSLRRPLRHVSSSPAVLTINTPTAARAPASATFTSPSPSLDLGHHRTLFDFDSGEGLSGSATPGSELCPAATDSGQLLPLGGGAAGASSLSRNSSAVNLTSLVPRSVSSARLSGTSGGDG